MSKSTLHTGIGVVVTLLVVGVFFILGVPFSTSSISTQSQAGEQVMFQDEAVGTGATAQPGDTISVNYTGKLQDGTVFDSSTGREPYTFVLGTGAVIPGWEQGLVGTQAGTKRLLIVPPSMAYGPQDYGPIPGNSTLLFEIEVVSVTPAAQ